MGSNPFTIGRGAAGETKKISAPWPIRGLCLDGKFFILLIPPQDYHLPIPELLFINPFLR
jgi:hypothetical protein